jgi:mycothiol system anti-sigma-R factor
MISCDEAINRLWAYLDDTIGEVDRALLEEHLGLCRRCCGELEFAHELRRLLARSARTDIPAEVLARLKQTLEELDR